MKNESLLLKMKQRKTNQTQVNAKKSIRFIDPTMTNQLFYDVTKRLSFVHSADSRSARQEH